jgi:hypothetical protein
MDIVSTRRIREECYQMQEMQERGKTAPELWEITEVAQRALVAGAEEQGRGFLQAGIACQVEEIAERSKISDAEKAARGLWQAAAFSGRVQLETREPGERAVLVKRECEERTLLAHKEVEEKLWGLQQEEIRVDELVERECVKVCESFDRAAIKEAQIADGHEILLALLLRHEAVQRSFIALAIIEHFLETMFRFDIELAEILVRPRTVRRILDFHRAKLLQQMGSQANVSFLRGRGSLRPISGNIPTRMQEFGSGKKA